jgi:hypothetical protein
MTTSPSNTSARTAGVPIDTIIASLGAGSSVGIVVYAVNTGVPSNFDGTDRPASRQASCIDERACSRPGDSHLVALAEAG